MKRHNLLKFSSIAGGGLLVGLLAICLPGMPIKWMQSALLTSLGGNVGEVHAGWSNNQNERMGSFEVAQGARPAATSESPEEIQLKKLPPAMPPGQVRRPSKAELLDKCLKTPDCQAKAKEIQQGDRNMPRPAAREESPEEKALKQLPPAIPPKVRPQGPHSGLMMHEDIPGLLSWLNPFHMASVHAFTLSSSYYLTPSTTYTSNAYMVLYGARVYPGNQYYLASYDSISNSYTENEPYAFLRFSVPATGAYLINVQASRGKAKLRHQYNGPIIGTWDFTAQSYGTYDYITSVNLAQGTHYFYFWPDGSSKSSMYVYSASLEPKK
jgi:hypothetical protein